MILGNVERKIRKKDKTQFGNLREIIFGGSKNAFLAILGAFDFVNLVIFSLQSSKSGKIYKNQNSEPLDV